MKIYLDNCCLNRPFDDQRIIRIRLESEAIKKIFQKFDNNDWELIISDISIFEAEKINAYNRKRIIQLILSKASFHVKINERIKNRALYFETNGIKAFDALHLASAEEIADIFLTVDDSFLKRANAVRDIKIRTENPLQWIQEIF